MSRKYYAKSDTKETIKQHTDRLLENLKLLKQCYEEEILKVNNIDKDRFFYLLEIVCKYHDIGKAFTAFQNMILKNIGEKTIETEFKYNVRHEQLSPMFVPIQKLGLSSEEKKLEGSGEKYIPCGTGSIKNNTRQTAADIAAEAAQPLPFSAYISQPCDLA